MCQSSLTFSSDSFRDVSILLKFPELLAAPLFNPATFGRSGRVDSGNRGKVSFSLRWTLVNMLVTVCGIAILAVYVGLSKEIENTWNIQDSWTHTTENPWAYVLTLLMVMCIAMVWMVPLMGASMYPDHTLSDMYQQGVLDLSNPDIQFVVNREEVYEIDGEGKKLQVMVLREFLGNLPPVVLPSSALPSDGQS